MTQSEHVQRDAHHSGNESRSTRIPATTSCRSVGAWAPRSLMRYLCTGMFHFPVEVGGGVPLAWVDLQSPNCGILAGVEEREMSQRRWLGTSSFGRR